jgi:hypothetical protein
LGRNLTKIGIMQKKMSKGIIEAFTSKRRFSALTARSHLAVPFTSKDEAKTLGARWDSIRLSTAL